MLRKLMLMATGIALGLSITLSSLAQDAFRANGVLETLNLEKMILVTDDGTKYRLSPERLPAFEKQQHAGQLRKGTLIQLSGHWGRDQEGGRVAYVERIGLSGR